MKHDVVLFNSPCTDILIPMERALPLMPDISVRISDFIEMPGGISTQCFAAAHIGLDYLPLGIVGDDNRGKDIMQAYEKAGIPTEGLQLLPGYKTSVAISVNGPDGDHALLSLVNNLPPDFEKMRPFVEGAKYVHVTGYQLINKNTYRENELYLELAASLGKEIWFDPCPLIDDIPPEVLRRTLEVSTAVVMNKSEARRITGETEIPAAAKALCAMSSGFAVIKDGGNGCYLATNGEDGHWIGGFPVQAVDTTGCGDTFITALNHAILLGWDLDHACIFANAMGAAMAKKAGCGPNSPTFDEVAAVLEAGGYTVSDKDKSAKKFTEPFWK